MRSYLREPVAIVGSSCHFPGGATSPSKLWELLDKPRDIVQEIPPSRFNTKAFYHPDPQHHGSTNVKHAYLLEDDPRAFDRDFFSINPKEAEAMDPQQRMLLETVYEGIESTGYSLQQLRGSSTAVFVGCMSYDYQFTAIRGIDSLPQYHATGTAASILANRLSYFYDWRGPSVTIDTACSSSLVALHQAVSALRNGEADMAVVAGSNLIVGPEPFISESKLNMLSPNGRSYMWDAAADGYTRGEGFCAIFVKTLDKAIADGDHIESIIRETGVNSDGKTPGITMPSSKSQAQLMLDTYAKCGLNLAYESDRPQYFEAHGTGTQAGDPIEAQAIQSVFFPGKISGQLLVGSIKTVIGHTEGAAGIAGVLKASLAVQHSQIPANLHFKNLNPAVQPFYTNLKIPTENTPWPAIPKGTPRRVSVNSFGFGGTNAHAIIESWDETGSPTSNLTLTAGTLYAGPFVLSANSATSLAANAGSLANYLRSNPGTDLTRLAYTLFRKTDFPFRAAFSATHTKQLAEKLEAAKDILNGSSRTAMIPEGVSSPRILGVFTGQGAQWATMGKGLYENSFLFRKAIDQMQQSLNSLPAKEHPDWTLVDQMNAPKETSRVNEAIVAQPLCTALQVALVDMLYAAGVEFSAVVGHSSGEIGAAYAAGYLNATDAIRIAYYRGMHAQLAQGPGGKRGKMMAVGMSLSQATAFCNHFHGTLSVAASNSQTSCTLAGDAEAIDDAFAQLREKGTFARLLQVDTAYHSHHMKTCSTPYFKSIKQCGVKLQKGRKRCRWYSSVWGLEGRFRSFDQMDGHLLEGQYWVDNMTKTVLFNEALSRVFNEDQSFSLALEIGPHPALKGPVMESTKILTGFSLPYSGVLKRGENSAESFADALGLLWRSFLSKRPHITFEGVRRAFQSSTVQTLSILKGLPNYSFDHSNLIWRESRSSRIFLTQNRPRHQLLGHSITHGEHSNREMHWKQVLRLNELPWLTGHVIQSEVLFPVSGYISMAYEAAIHLVDDEKSLRLVEMRNIDIARPMRLQEDPAGLEIIFTLRITSQSHDCITAKVTCYSGAVNSAQRPGINQPRLTANFAGDVLLWLGEPDRDILPRRMKPCLPLEVLDIKQFYSSLLKEGFGYTELFQAKGMLRRLNRAEVAMSLPPKDSTVRTCMHPAPLDTAFQGLVAAFSFPGDGRISAVYLPTRIESVKISMLPASSRASVFKADAIITAVDKDSLTGDIDLFDAAGVHTEVQIRGVRLTTVKQRRNPWLYAETTWSRHPDDGIEPGLEANLSEAERELYEQLQRTAHFYLRQLCKDILPQELFLISKLRKHMMTWITEHLLPQIDAGEHPEVRPEWKNDTLEMVEQWRASQPANNNDMNILHAVGKKLAGLVRGTVSPLKLVTQNDMLDRMYVEGLGYKDGNVDLGVIIKQLAHVHPRMRILEVGAGAGGSTSVVLNSLKDQYSSYTFTDISTSFFDNAREKFSQHMNKLVLKTLNIENEPTEQGFVEGAYDLVVSSICLHATQSLNKTLSHCRKLLRPGGRLVLLEVTQDFLPTQLIMSTLPGWFVGIDDGRVWAPTVSVKRWDELLKANGFSGVDAASTPSHCTVMLAQAVDLTVELLRNPLTVFPTAFSSLGEVLIVGGGNDSPLASQTLKILQTVGTFKSITITPGVEGIQVPKGAAVLGISDLATPVFHDMNKPKFEGLQNIVENAKAVLWVGSGAKSGQVPEANMMVGLFNTVRAERTDLRLQCLDIDDPLSFEPCMLAKMFLRLALLDKSKAEELLWNHEPELALKDGALYIPRVRGSESLNFRSTARLRQVVRATSPAAKDTSIRLGKHQGVFQLQTVPFGNAQADESQLRVTASSLFTATCDTYGQVHVIIGRDSVSQEKVLALSNVNSSLVKLTEDRVLARWPGETPDVKNVEQLHLFLSLAFADNLVNKLKGPTWIHGASIDLCEAIDLIASKRGVAVFQTTSDMRRITEDNFIHPFAREDDLPDIRGKNLQGFVNLTGMQHETLSTFVKVYFPASAILNVELKSLATFPSLLDLHVLAMQSFETGSHDTKGVIETVGIEEAGSVRVKELGPTAIFDWSTADSINAHVQPLQHQGLFTADKTYLLCGMTGDLGLSVCLWMVEHGARNVVLASRKPNVCHTVLDYISRKGAKVIPMAVDISDVNHLRAAYADIKANMPPIGGIMNAAMVLRDRIFNRLIWEDFFATLAPKVAGTKNLDEVFGNEQLDFFICFSSTTSVVGSIGQSAYGAANQYMASLIAQRRQRGLAGSVLHIAILAGIGYISRQDSEHTDTIYKAISPRLNTQSETDLHEMLAESIVCGRPGSGHTGELITGIKPVFQGEWRDDPRLYAYSSQEQLQESDNRQQTHRHISVKDQLATIEDVSGCLNVVETSFTHALGNLLELDPKNLDKMMPVASLGIDSLVAIRIREWFLKEMDVDVPVIDIMSDNYSISRICSDAFTTWKNNKNA